MDNRFYLAGNVSRPLLSSTSSVVKQESTSQPTFSIGFTSFSSPISTSTSTPAAPHPEIRNSVGIGAGTGFGVIVIGVGFWFFIKRRGRHRANKKQYLRSADRERDVADETSKFESNETPLAQLESESRMPATPEIHGASRNEIDGASRHEMEGASSHGRLNNDIRRYTPMVHNT